MEGVIDAYNAFWGLSTERQVGMDLGPIPASAIERYGVKARITHEDEFKSFEWLIREADDEFLSYYRSKSSSSAPKEELSAKAFDSLFG